MAYRDYDYYMDTHRLRIAVRRPAGGKAGESLGAGAGLQAWRMQRRQLADDKGVPAPDLAWQQGAEEGLCSWAGGAGTAAGQRLCAASTVVH